MKIKSTDNFSCYVSLFLFLIAGLLNVMSRAALAAPVLETDPASITDTLTEGTISSHTISLSNAGDGTLTYRILASETLSSEGPGAVTAFHSKKQPAVSGIPPYVRYVPGEIIVKLAPGTAVSARASVRNSIGATVIRSVPKLNLEIWKLPPAMHTTDSMVMSLNALSAERDVLYAEPNYIYTAAGLPNDPLFNELWGMHNTGQTGGTDDSDIDAPEAWDVFTGSPDVIVAVIDTGVDYNHEDLAVNMWRNEDEIPGNGIDDDGNGFIDDIYGYDFANNDPDPQDDHYHGTHCAGIIGAAGNNNIGVAGVTHHVRIMAAKFLDQSGSGPVSDAVEAIIYAVDNGAMILNNSWGGSAYSYALADAIVYANDHGALFVAAAGNNYADTDMEPFYPAGYDVPNVMSIAATDHNDYKALFSNWGPTSVDLGAPGENILSTFPGNQYALLSGTSMAAPHVSGAAALLKGYYPAFSFSDIKTTIMNSVDPVSPLAGITVTGGRLNVANALFNAIPGWINISGDVQGDIPAGFSAEITVRIDATGRAPGAYGANITVVSNDPVNPLYIIPVHVTILPDCCPPAAVNDLRISAYGITDALVRWTAVGDDGYNGRASGYDIRYSTVPLDENTWDNAIQAAGEPVPGDPGTVETFEISGLSSDTHYWIGMKVRDNAGQFSLLSNIAEITTVENRWVSVEAGGNHTAALKTDGTLWAWGYNAYGQLGDGTKTSRNIPAQTGSDRTWVSVTAGFEYTLALKADGTLWGWGRNNYGQLGIGTTIDKNIPVQIGGDHTWVSFAAGAWHTMALKADGTLWGWGRNNYGQLGIGTTIDKNIPVQIGSDHTWVSFAAGAWHTMALKADGTLWAWGRNNYGQLGNGTNIDSSIPVQTGSDHTWDYFSAGTWHSAALKTDGSLWTWGYNNFGQLGDGTSAGRTSPVLINMLPVAEPGGPYSASEGQAVRLDGTGSFDPDGSITNYEWDVDNNGVYECSSPSPLCDHAYSQQGAYTIRLRVTDKFGASDERTTSAYITDSSPIADFTGSPTGGDTPLSVNFTNSSTGYDSPLSYEWYFDGTDDGSPDATAVNPSNIYGPGVYSVLLKAVDSDSSVNSLLRTNYITVCYPPANIPGDPTVYSSLQAAYDAARELDIIQSRDVAFAEDLVMDRNIPVSMEGGYDCLHSSQTGTTTVDGDMAVIDGSVRIQSGTLMVMDGMSAAN
jgi:subtilisin family serine protease/PKD repeat protein